jgi:CHAT domain-containing protein
LGEKHDETAYSYERLAQNYVAQGELKEARDLLGRSVAAYEAARLVAADRALERSIVHGGRSPYGTLAAVEASLGNFTGAWLAAEADLGRGLSDEAATRRGATLSVPEESRQAEIRTRVRDLQPLIQRIAVKQVLSADDEEELKRLRDERRVLENEAAELAVNLSKRELGSIASVQAALPSGSALLLWVDSPKNGPLQEHWGCVVRNSGEPIWRRLRAAGAGGKWGADDSQLPEAFATATATASADEVARLASNLYAQRIAPLERDLDGVNRLFVVPVRAMAGVPVEVLTGKYAVSYVPSGSFLARPRGGREMARLPLLAVGDPVFSDGATNAGANKMFVALRGADWSELPGSAVEVAELQALTSGDSAIALTRSAASEQQLEELRLVGKLEQFAYLHFATHGEPNNAESFESALILSQDKIDDAIEVTGKHFDGRLTANEVLENWKLNADLVTLSACESALGRPGGGDGLLGFAQAFLLAGARSVCLSLWKVDDTATSLLMKRFYQNLLGKREGLSQPMPKVEALAEAKQWLRNLTYEQANKLTSAMSNGISRGKGEKAVKLVVPPAEPLNTTAEAHPFAHPRYWAAFILIGDPK